MLNIALDVDDTIADFTKIILEYNNGMREAGNPSCKKELHTEDITSDLETVMGKVAFEECFYWAMQMDNAIKTLPIITGAIEFVNALREQNHRVIFTTAPSFKYDMWCDQRRFWLLFNFACTDNDIAFVHDKNLINADILIDDRPKYLEPWFNSGKPCIRMLKPWNVNSVGTPARTFDEALYIINKLKDKWIK